MPSTPPGFTLHGRKIAWYRSVVRYPAVCGLILDNAVNGSSGKPHMMTLRTPENVVLGASPLSQVREDGRTSSVRQEPTRD